MIQVRWKKRLTPCKLLMSPQLTSFIIELITQWVTLSPVKLRIIEQNGSFDYCEVIRSVLVCFPILLLASSPVSAPCTMLISCRKISAGTMSATVAISSIQTPRMFPGSIPTVIPKKNGIFWRDPSRVLHFRANAILELWRELIYVCMVFRYVFKCQANDGMIIQ